MNLWDELVSELAVLSIRVDSKESVTIANAHGQKSFPITDAINYVRDNLKKNIEFLIGLWEQSTDLLKEKLDKPSNTITQRLFIAAIKHLAKQSYGSSILRKKGFSQILQHTLNDDLSVYSEDVMGKIIEFRLSIDWVTHLVNYDAYRLSLLEVISRFHAKEETQTKLSYYMNNLDIPIIGERATPWKFLKDTIEDHRSQSSPLHLRGPNEQNSVTPDKSLLPDIDPREDQYFATDPVKWEDIYEESSIPLNTKYRT